MDGLQFSVDIWDKDLIAGWALRSGDFRSGQDLILEKCSSLIPKELYVVEQFYREDVERALETKNFFAFHIYPSLNGKSAHMDLTDITLNINSERVTYLAVQEKKAKALRGESSPDDQKAKINYLMGVLMHTALPSSLPSLLLDDQPYSGGPQESFCQTIMEFLSQQGEGFFAPYTGFNESLWSPRIHKHFGELYQVAATRDSKQLRSFFAKAHQKWAVFGITQGPLTYKVLSESSDGSMDHYLHKMLYRDPIISLYEYLECGPVECLDQGVTHRTTSDRLMIEKIQKKIGFNPEYKDPFGGMYRYDAGGAGHFHMRDIYALYHAIKVKELADTFFRKANPVVCEIGAGLGQVIYYLFKLQKTTRATMVDTPPVLAMQAYNLKSHFPDMRIEFGSFEGPGIQLISCFNLQPDYLKDIDLFLNCDSFPEMGPIIIEKYLQLIADSKAWLFSSNQEALSDIIPESTEKIHQPRVSDIALKHLKRISRNRSFIRRGYLEEVYAPKETTF